MSADLLRRAAAELRLLEDAGSVPVARRELAVALADWLDREADRAAFLGEAHDGAAPVAVARAILREEP